MKCTSNTYGGPSKRPNKARDARLDQLKAELRELLRQPLVARGVSTRYVTSGSRPIAHDMMAGECQSFHFHTLPCLSDTRTDHEGMIGVRKTDAFADFIPKKERKVEKKGSNSLELEEWSGIE